MQKTGVRFLTVREREVLQLISEGKASKEIAFQLGISFRTACCHRWHLLTKLAVHNTAELIRKAVQSELISLERFDPAAEAPERVGTTRSVDPLMTRLGLVLEENRRLGQTLSQSLAAARATCERAQSSTRQLEAAVEQTIAACDQLKQAPASQRRVSIHVAA